MKEKKDKKEEEMRRAMAQPRGGPKPEKLGVQIAYSKRSILIDAEQYFLGLKGSPLMGGGRWSCDEKSR